MTDRAEHTAHTTQERKMREQQSGMRCHDCREEHDDWEKAGEKTIHSYQHAGKAVLWDCGRCGARTEVHQA